MRQKLTLCAMLLLFGSPLNGQTTVQAWDPAGLQLTRADLEQMLERYEQTAGAAGYSQALRIQAEEEAALIRERLREGDLQTGDRVVLEVEGHETLSNTFTVTGTRSIMLPEIGAVPLLGVLRSELQSHITSHLSRFLRDPVVRAQSMVRLEITGAVARPGFYAVASDVLVSDALMVAGGPTPTAELDAITIQRGSDEIWSADRMRAAIVDGRTLDQLSVRAGDGIRVPEQGNRMETLRNVGLMVTGVASFVTLMLQVF